MKRTITYAFCKTIPVLLGYLFLGLAFGLLLQKSGYSFWWALLSSTVIYAGSIQFVLVDFLSGGTSLPVIAVMTLLINSRHAFYGLTFIERFRKMKTCPYMIFSLTDETYSLLCSTRIPEDLDEKKVSFLISFFDQCYWIVGSVLGGLIGEILPFDTTGIDFAMTALFVTIFVEQWIEAKSHLPAIIGLCSSLICLLIFGGNSFILPSLIITVTLLMAMRKQIQGEEVPVQ
jgi:4-azaleucine resistance transporter AzlC